MEKTGSCYNCKQTVSLDYDGAGTGYIAPHNWEYIEVPDTDEFFLHCPTCLPEAREREKEYYLTYDYRVWQRGKRQWKVSLSRSSQAYRRRTMTTAYVYFNRHLLSFEGRMSRIPEDFVLAAKIENCRDAEEAFTLTQNINKPWRITRRVTSMSWMGRSMAVGDIVVRNGRALQCNNFGWTEL